MTVDVFTRLTDPSLPEVIEFGRGARVIHLQGGDVGPMDKNAVFDQLPEFVGAEARPKARRHVECPALAWGPVA